MTSAGSEGTPGLDQLVDDLYAELRSLAARRLEGRTPHSVQPTTLVHEAYVRLRDQRTEWQNRSHFLAVASRVIRRVLADHTRARAGKRPVQLEDELAVAGADRVDFVDLDEALIELAAVDEGAVRIVELRFFGGLSIRDTAAALGLSKSTVHERWEFASAWLRRQLDHGGRE